MSLYKDADHNRHQIGEDLLKSCPTDQTSYTTLIDYSETLDEGSKKPILGFLTHFAAPGNMPLFTANLSSKNKAYRDEALNLANIAIMGLQSSRGSKAPRQQTPMPQEQVTQLKELKTAVEAYIKLPDSDQVAANSLLNNLKVLIPIERIADAEPQPAS